MYQVIPPRLFGITITWFVISLVAISIWGESTFAAHIPLRYIVVVINVLLFALTIKPVWRCFWRWFPALNRWFPDLNGVYDVELRHNWPIQKRLLDAATGSEKFDPRLPENSGVQLGLSRLKAEIDLGFYSVHVRMWAANDDSKESIIEESRTLTASLVRACDGQPHRIVYVYEQKNRRDRQKSTDDSVFEGSAILNVSKQDSNELRGEYWTNRAWHQGLSTAGNIVLRRVRV